MKKYLKLLKAWKDPSGKEFKAGEYIEIAGQNDAEKALIGSLLMEGTAELVEEKAAPAAQPIDAAAIGAAVKSAIQPMIDAAKTASDAQTAAISKITGVHDKSDDDPAHGYLPEKNREHTKAEKLYGMGLFAADVFRAGEGMARPSERLTKSIQRSRDMVTKAMNDGIIAKAAGTGMTIQEDDSMGALIPPEFSTMLLDVAAETAIIRPRASTLSISSNTIELPRISDYDRSGGLVYGGLVGYWKAENAAFTESRLKHDNLQLTLSALTILAYASHESMRFSPFDLGAYLLPKMASAMTWKEEDAFINGTGLGMPQGIMNAGCNTAVTAESGQTSSANVIVTANVDKMIQRLKVTNAASCVFLYNRPQLYNWLVGLYRPTGGTSGALASLFISNNPLNGQATLNGIPCLDSEHMPAAATQGDLTLVDLSNYVIADDRRGAEVASSIHLKFDYGQMAWRTVKYVDGQCADKKATTRYKGSNTISPVMTIATRS